MKLTTDSTVGCLLDLLFDTSRKETIGASFLVENVLPSGSWSEHVCGVWRMISCEVPTGSYDEPETSSDWGHYHQRRSRYSRWERQSSVPPPKHWNSAHGTCLVTGKQENCNKWNRISSTKLRFPPHRRTSCHQEVRSIRLCPGFLSSTTRHWCIIK